jgi:hypothetical protein
MSATATGQRPGPKELMRGLEPNAGGELALLREAFEHGRTLQAHLDVLMPQEEYKDGLSGLGRMLREAPATNRFPKGIRVTSDPANGVWCDTVQAFEDRGALGSTLLIEWAQAVQRRVMFSNVRADIGGSDIVAPNTTLRPYVQTAARRPVIEPPIPISELVAMTVPITGDAFRQLILVNTADADVEERRVPQGSPIPLASISTSEKTGRIYKYGIGIEFTYEALRRIPIEQFAYFIEQEQAATERAKFKDIVDAIIAGDGEAGSAATAIALTTLDPTTTALNMTFRAWVALKMEFGDSFNMTTALARKDVGIALNLLNWGTANHPARGAAAEAGIGFFRPINRNLRDGTDFGVTTAVAANKLLAFDSARAIVRHTESGADITEFERFVRRQTQAVYFSNVEGYGTLTPGSAWIVDLAA